MNSQVYQESVATILLCYPYENVGWGEFEEVLEFKSRSVTDITGSFGLFVA